MADLIKFEKDADAENDRMVAAAPKTADAMKAQVVADITRDKEGLLVRKEAASALAKADEKVAVAKKAFAEITIKEEYHATSSTYSGNAKERT